MEINPINMNPVTTAYLKKIDEETGKNTVMEIWKQKANRMERMEQFDKVMELVDTAREVYMSTNQSLPSLITELIQSLHVLSNESAQHPQNS